MSDDVHVKREILPIPDVSPVGLTTYDANDPDAAFPSISSLRAYLAGIVAVLLGAALVFVRFPMAAEEKRLLAAYHAEDTGAAP